MKIRELIKLKLDEAVGVPKNIEVSAEKIYNDFYNHLEENVDVEDQIEDYDELRFMLQGPYDFSDIKIKGVEMTLTISDSNNFDFYSMSIKHNTKIGIPKVTYGRKEYLDMSVDLGADYADKMGDLLDYIRSIKPQIISSFAHEIMHDYDFFKNPERPVESSIEYIASQKGKTGIFLVNMIILGNYYIHHIENIVRPSEVYTELIQNGATKKDFQKKLNETSFVEKLNIFRNLTYDKFYQELKNNVLEVFSILKDNNIDVQNKSPENIVNHFLYLLRQGIISDKVDLAGIVAKQVTSFDDVLKSMMGVETNSEIFFRKFINKATSGKKYYEYDYEYQKSKSLNEEFYTKRINKIVEGSNRIFRKIAKIYSLLPDDNTSMTLNKKISMKKSENKEMVEVSNWENPDYLFGKKYPNTLVNKESLANIKKGLFESDKSEMSKIYESITKEFFGKKGANFPLDIKKYINEEKTFEERIVLLENLIKEEKIKEDTIFILTEMKKIGIEKLPYAYSSLKPFIDSKTMDIHYNKHYKGYVKKLNKALSKRKGGDVDLEEIIKSITKYSDDIRNNAGGAFNHALFWNMLSPKKTKPSTELSTKLVKDFGSFQKFKTSFENVAKARFGSGWAWLIITNNKKLKVVSTPNQDNPLMNVVKDGGFPLLGLDLWEHAYYLKYQNKRDEYISNFWDVVNWDFVSKMYEMKTNTEL